MVIKKASEQDIKIIAKVAETAYINATRALEKSKEFGIIASQAFNESKKSRKDNERIKKENGVIRREQKNLQFRFIEILAIFIAAIGFLFSSINFFILPQFKFLEVTGLIILFGIILYGFVKLIHKLFSVES